MADRTRLTALSDADLGMALVDLGGALAIPAIAPGAIDPAARARLRIVAAESAIPAGPRRPWAWLTPSPGRRVGRGVALALVAVVALAAVAGAIGLGLPGIRIVPAPTASPVASATFSTGPSSSPSPTVRPAPTARPTIADPLGSNLGLGPQVTIGGASSAVDIPVVLPTAPGIGAPESAWLLDGRLTFVWRTSPTLPELTEPGVGLILSEFRGSLEPGYFEKVIDQGTTIESASIDGITGYWITGAPHEIVYVNDRGDPVFDSRRSVGDTLLWARGDVTYRIESALGRAATIAVAESLR